MKYKQILIVLFILFQTSNALSQDKIYFDKNWKTTTKKNATYYRIIVKENDSLYAVKDYYINGVLQMQGHITSLKKDIFQGEVNWYDKNGKKTITRNYKNGILEGDVIDYSGPFSTRCYYKNFMPYSGTIYSNNTIPAEYIGYLDGKQEFSYSYYKNSTQVAVQTSYYYHKKYKNYYPLTSVFYDKNNQIIATLNYHKNQGFVPENGTKITFYLEDNQPLSIKSKINYSNSILDGKAIIYHENGKKWLRGIYINGKKYNGDFLENTVKTNYKNGVLTEKIKYDKDFNILAKLILKNGKPFEGSEYIHKGIATYHNGKLKSEKEFYDYKRKEVKKISTCTTDNVCTIKWCSKQGKLLGIGVSENNNIIDGLEIAYNKLIYYKNGRKNGIQKEYKSDFLKELILKTLYENDIIVWTKTKKIFENTFYHCDYRNNEPYEGVIYANDYKHIKFYKKGKLVKKVAYKQNPKTKELSINSIKFYDGTSKYETLSKEIRYIKGKEYTLTYKNHTPYNGKSWFGNTLFTYKNGKKEGVYEVYDRDKTTIVEKGKYINDLRQGIVTYTPLKNDKHSFFKHKQSACYFVDDKPYNGTVSTQRETTHYKNGKKTGIHSTNFDVYTNIVARKTSYLNDKKEGEETTYLIRNKVVKGIYKNDKPFSGEIYNLKNNNIETYIEGKKEGDFIAINDYSIRQIQFYEKGKLLSEKTIFTDNDTIIGEGVYKNNLPYQGKFVAKQKEHKQYLVTPYEKGIKDGVEKLISIDKGIKTITLTTYKKGKKEGVYQSNYHLTDTKKPINGIYKNNKPYSGKFITKKEKDFYIVSSFKKGLKEGYETYFFKNKKDRLLYKKGKPVDGIQYEIIKGTYKNSIAKHFYKKKKKYKTILEDYTPIAITYSGNGFVIDNSKYYYRTGFDKISVVFHNKKQTKGTIQYYLEDDTIGEFDFEDGRLLRGKMVCRGDIYGLFSSYEIKVDNTFIELTLKARKEFNIYSVFFLQNQIPNKLTYKNYKLLLDGLVDYNDKNKEIRGKQYLLDGTFISEITYGNKENSGALINFKKDNTGKIVYQIAYYKKGEDKPIEIEGLSFDEMLEELKKDKTN